MKAKICPICQNIYPANLPQCPNCQYKEPMDGKLALRVALSILFVAIIFNFLNEDNAFKNFFKKEEISNIQQEFFYGYKENNQGEIIKIPIRPMSSLSGLTKAEIYEDRIKYVNNSIIFSKLNKNYYPRQEVYNIVDNLPWISAYEVAKNGVENNPDIGVGESRHSIFVNNPELLMGFIIPDYNRGKNREDFDETDYMLPTKITWDEKNKTIRAYFDFSSYFKKHYYFKGSSFYVDETNARDLGYDWILCEDKKRVIFSSVDNISKVPYKTRGYYHRGYGCRLENGCNNYSPHQSSMDFKIMDSNAYMKFKFWKNKPLSKFQKADLIYEMYFE